MGVEFLLEKDPLPNTGFFITPFDVPGLEGLIQVIQNEQFLIGDGINNQSISVNALHIIINSGMIKLPPGFADGTWAGEIIDAHSFAELTAESDPAAIPEPSTFLIWALGLVGLAWYARRRRTK